MASAPEPIGLEPAPDTGLLIAAYAAAAFVLLALGGLLRILRAVSRQLGRAAATKRGRRMRALLGGRGARVGLAESPRGLDLAA
jgi:hypothetical protein